MPPVHTNRPSLFSLALFAVALANSASAAVFINELHYDDSSASGDTGERVEVVATAGESLDGYRIVLYNGSGGAQYDDDPLPTGALRTCGATVRLAVISYPSNGIQNGAPDGLALVDPAGAVVQFLSYEGAFAATSGPASGMTSIDIGVLETNATAAGTSLQLSGQGNTPAQFSWQPSRAESFGECNAGQTFVQTEDLPPSVASTVPVQNAVDVNPSANLTVVFSEPVSLGGGAFALTCAATGPRSLGVTLGSEGYMLDPATDLGFDEACTLTITATEVVDLDFKPNTMASDIVISFRTAPDGAPAVVSTQPSNGATGVPASVTLGVNFSEPVSVSGDWVRLNCGSSGSVALSISGGPAQWSLDPSASLQPLESCSLRVVASQVADLDGLPDPLAADVVVEFMTSAGPGAYYAGVDASSCTALRETLHAAIDDHTFYPYTATTTDTWDILEVADQDPMNPGRVVDVYRNASYAKAGGGNSNYNREHTWPNSYGYNDLTGDHAYTDAHMLYLSNSAYNSSRSNIPYGNCDMGCNPLITDLTNGQGGGPQVYPGQHNWFSTTLNLFEVWSARKGDVARAVLYMDIRYEGGMHGITNRPEPDLIVVDNPGLIQTTPAGAFAVVGYMGLRSTLLQWHASDPPDANEQLRNDVVFSYQGNRNPFIDHPEWAECLHTCTCSSAPPVEIFGNGFEG
jgi:endonuclease I